MSSLSHFFGGWLLFLSSSWLFFLDGGGIFSILSLHFVSVSVGNADEVGVGDAKGGGLGKNDEEVELLGHLGVGVGLWVTLSSEDGVVLVDENVVADNPDGNQGGGDDSEHASSEKFSSAGSGILSEENDKEARSNAHWGKEHDNDNWEVPVNVIVKDQEEVHGNQVDGKKNSPDTNGNNTALNWEATAASRFLGIFIAASAEAAAAWSKLLFSSNRDTFFFFLLSWSVFFFFFHHWSSLVHHHIHFFVSHCKIVTKVLKL
jgi:hypothetical protein